MSKTIHVALVGNPNTGKTSLFNALTGLTQKVGNYPGITVEKKQGRCTLSSGFSANITDLPGTYSINPTSLDESIVLETVLLPSDQKTIDVLLVVAEVENLKRNLLLFSQVRDLGIPTILVINMADQMEEKGISIDVSKIEEEFRTKVVLTSVRKNTGIEILKEEILKYKELSSDSDFTLLSDKIDANYFSSLQKVSNRFGLYQLWLIATRNPSIALSKEEQVSLDSLRKDAITYKKHQHKEAIYRYQRINKLLGKAYDQDFSKTTNLRGKLDRIFTHKIFGYLIFFGILLLIFNSIFEWATVPMDYIDGLFADISEYLKGVLPEGKISNLIIDGIIPGLGGVVIFVPQIAILFLFIAILEETGYMSRVVFLMDKIMRRFGMSGKSIIPLISGTACAIPAIMSTRTISGWKERLITILVVPFTTCSARLPVYTILIAIVIPDKKVLGFLNLQGLTLLGLYLLGFFMAVFAAYILHKILAIKSSSFFVAEMPQYKLPSPKNVLLEVLQKTKSFVLGAGKIILSISIILWFLATNGPGDFANIEQSFTEKWQDEAISEKDLEQKIAAVQLEKSYIGIMGKVIEPAVKPLGYDWKIGIGIITSFAAREVFVGTLATIYSVGSDAEDTETIKEKMAAEINPDTGDKQFDFPTGISLLLFYAFAMQCIATLAIVKRETNSWKWPILQLFGMGIIAYLAALISYQILR